MFSVVLLRIFWLNKKVFHLEFKIRTVSLEHSVDFFKGLAVKVWLAKEDSYKQHCKQWRHEESTAVCVMQQAQQKDVNEEG